MSFEISNVMRNHDTADSLEYGLGVSLYTDYIPHYAVFTQYEKSSTYPSDGIITYPRLSIDNGTARAVYSRYSDLFRHLNGGRSAGVVGYTFKTGEFTHKIYIAPGVIMDNHGNILLLLSVEKGYFKEYWDWFMNKGTSREEELDFSKVKLFVSKEFFSEYRYGVIWKKIEKEFYYEAIIQGVEIEVKSNTLIHNQFYNDGINVNFPTLDGLHSYLNIDIWDRMVEDAQAHQLSEEQNELLPTFVFNRMHNITEEEVEEFFEDTDELQINDGENGGWIDDLISEPATIGGVEGTIPEGVLSTGSFTIGTDPITGDGTSIDTHSESFIYDNDATISVTMPDTPDVTNVGEVPPAFIAGEPMPILNMDDVGNPYSVVATGLADLLATESLVYGTGGNTDGQSFTFDSIVEGDPTEGDADVEIITTDISSSQVVENFEEFNADEIPSEDDY